MGELSVRELPLFPLPEVVLFPQEVLPLHIFESRYRIMLQSVLESDSMFGVIKWDSNTKSMAILLVFESHFITPNIESLSSTDWSMILYLDSKICKGNTS